MKHDHGHPNCCKHENLKFCGKCQQPYCLDCGREWYATQTNYTYPYIYRTSPYQIWSSGRWSADDAAIGSSSTQITVTETGTACAHS